MLEPLPDRECQHHPQVWPFIYTMSSTNPNQLSLVLTLAVKSSRMRRLPPTGTQTLQTYLAANHRYSRVYFSLRSTADHKRKSNSSVVQGINPYCSKCFLMLGLLALQLQVCFWLANCRQVLISHTTPFIVACTIVCYTKNCEGMCQDERPPWHHHTTCAFLIPPPIWITNWLARSSSRLQWPLVGRRGQ